MRIENRYFFEARPDGGRPRGRPRVTYEECIEEMGGKYPKAWPNLKEWLKTEKSESLSPRTPPTLISN